LLILIGEDEILVEVSDAISVELDDDISDEVSVSVSVELDSSEEFDDDPVSDELGSEELDDVVFNVSNVSIVSDDFVELLRIEDDVLFLVLPLCSIVIFGGISLIY
jgi:hypothetical protein